MPKDVTFYVPGSYIIFWLTDIVHKFFCTPEGAIDPTFKQNMYQPSSIFVPREIKQKPKWVVFFQTPCIIALNHAIHDKRSQQMFDCCPRSWDTYNIFLTFILLNIHIFFPFHILWYSISFRITQIIRILCQMHLILLALDNAHNTLLYKEGGWQKIENFD